MKYRYYKKTNDIALLSEFMSYKEAFVAAKEKCLANVNSVYVVEREDGRIVDEFHKFYLQEMWGSSVGGPVFFHFERYKMEKNDWKIIGF